jgi:hypothetical protein
MISLAIAIYPVLFHFYRVCQRINLLVRIRSWLKLRGTFLNSPSAIKIAASHKKSSKDDYINPISFVKVVQAFCPRERPVCPVGHATRTHYNIHD